MTDTFFLTGNFKLGVENGEDLPVYKFVCFSSYALPFHSLIHFTLISIYICICATLPPWALRPLWSQVHWCGAWGLWPSPRTQPLPLAAAPPPPPHPEGGEAGVKDRAEKQGKEGRKMKEGSGESRSGKQRKRKSNGQKRATDFNPKDQNCSWLPSAPATLITALFKFD